MRFPSIREQLQATGYFTSLARYIPCQCKPDYVERCDRDKLYFTCELCLRIVPFCFGSADDFADYCDDCAIEARGILFTGEVLG